MIHQWCRESGPRENDTFQVSSFGTSLPIPCNNSLVYMHNSV